MATKANIIPIGIDIGNGKVKAYTGKGEGKPYELMFPSVYVNTDDIGSQIMEVKGAKADVDSIEIDGQKYFWGPDVAKMPNPIPSYGMDNRYATQAYKDMVQIALAKIAYDLHLTEETPLEIITGVPTEDIDEYGNLSASADDMKRAFKEQPKSVSVNGQEVVWKISDIDIIPQPTGSVMYYWVDDNGMVIEDNNGDHSEKKIAIIDVGGGTTDLDLFDGTSRLDRRTIRYGFRDVYNEIRKDISKQTGATNVDRASDDMLLANLEKKIGQFIFSYSAKYQKLNIADSYQRGITQLSDRISRMYNELVKNTAEYDYIFLTGGGARRILPSLKELIPQVELLPQNENSDVIGFYRYAVQD